MKKEKSKNKNKVLNDNNFQIAINLVKTANDNTTLRTKHLNADFSQAFKDAVVNNPKLVKQKER